LLLGQTKVKVDDRSYDQVRLKLAGARDVGGNAIEVTVQNGGAVILKGKVAKPRQKSKAEKLAKKVKGVKSVDNQLIVETR
jgi:osmotically-inducible protein OsmY